MTRTFLDSGVLLTAWRGKEGCEQALSVMEDESREFCTAQLVKLELMPKPAFFKQKLETEFYGTYFAQVKHEEPLTEDLANEAMALASAHGIAAADALNLCAALRLGADEFITSEKPGKPMFSVSRIRVISLHSLKSPRV
ncbi:MAG: PIN domain-containing protein [Verrucomicrobiota bacterium]|nr:PIN domain-containing protein [Verrucomicrobiota bacterium]